MRLFTELSNPDAWADASFRIAGSEHEGDGVVYHLVSKHAFRRVGLDIWVRNGMEPLSWDGEQPVVSAYRGGVVLRAVGARSDRFMRALAKAYGYRAAVTSMRSEVSATAIVLEGEGQPVKAKLFFNDGEDDDQGMYAELFLNIDSLTSKAGLAEKDPEYREGVILSLGLVGT